MRALVKENNVYRWAGNLIGELAGIRLDSNEAHRPHTNGWEAKRSREEEHASEAVASTVRM